MELIKGTKATLETEYGIVTIEIPEGDLNIDALFDLVISPLLLASGYSGESIDSLFYAE